MKVGIRVDVNPVIATGHIKRTLAVADYLSGLGHDVLFMCADACCEPFFKDTKFKYIILNTEWNNLDAETDIVSETVINNGIESLLIDSYYVTPQYMKRLSDLVKVTYFDEMYYKGYGCSRIVNYFPHTPDYSDYKGTVYTGPAYAPLRREFWNLPKRVVKDNITSLLVTSGGTDNYHFCRTFVKRFLEVDTFMDIKVILVVGRLSIDRDELLGFYSDNPRVNLYYDTNRMCELMQTADYAVTAGGTTLFEICASGLCASSFSMADNQVDITNSFSKAELISYAGDIRNDLAGVVDNIFTQITEAMPWEFRQAKSARLREIVDGRGAERVSDILVK